VRVEEYVYYVNKLRQNVDFSLQKNIDRKCPCVCLHNMISQDLRDYTI